MEEGRWEGTREEDGKGGRVGKGWGRGTEKGERRECLTLDRMTLMELVPQEG